MLEELDDAELQAVKVALDHLNTYDEPPDPPTPGMTAQEKVHRAMGLDAPPAPPTPPRSWVVYTYDGASSLCHAYVYDQDANPLTEEEAHVIADMLTVPGVTVMVLPAEEHVVG